MRHEGSLHARRSTGSILPAILCHLAVIALVWILIFTDPNSVLNSPLLMAASCVVLLATCYLLFKTSPPGGEYRLLGMSAGLG